MNHLKYFKKKDKIMSYKKFKTIQKHRGVNIDTSVFFLIKYQLPDSCFKMFCLKFLLNFRYFLLTNDKF